MSKSLIMAALALCAISARASYTFGYTGALTSYGTVVQDGKHQTLDTTFTISVFNTKSSGSTPSVTYAGNINGEVDRTTCSGFLTSPGSGLSGPSDPFDSFSFTSPAVGASLPFSATGVDTTFDLSFRLKKNAAPGDYTIFFHPNLNWNNSGAGTKVDSDAYVQIDVAAAPEPSQTIAGGLLLGCAGLIYASRRLVKKPVA